LANAEQEVEADLNRMVISRAIVDEGPLLGGRARWRPISRGRAVPILKRTCHIKITLSDAGEEEEGHGNEEAAGKEES
jgi:large subunit ribosomal protein L22